MDDTTVDGRTRDEWMTMLLTDGWSEAKARHVVAITFGDIPGDVIDEDEHTDLADEADSDQ